MLSQLPVDMTHVDPKNIDQEILRVGIIAELDAVNFYEQMAAKSQNPMVKKLLTEIAREEKTHVGEFETLLLQFDAEQVTEMEKGKKEVEEMA